MSAELPFPNIKTGQSFEFAITIMPDGVPVDISADTVTMTIKDGYSDAYADSEAVLQVNGDVITGGASGDAVFSLTPAQTAIDPGMYYIDFVWYTAGGDEHILPIKDTFHIVNRVSDR